jgi:putative peptidoglycan lipid II flippase
MLIARPLLAVSVPASIYLIAFAPDIVRLIFARGAFNETAVELTSGALRGIAAGLWATTLGMILLRFLNNQGRNRLAVIILAYAFAVNAALNLLAWRATGISQNGSMLLGLGEAARGLVLLLGASIALDFHRPLLRLLGLTLLPGAIMGGLCLLTLEAFTSSLLHLALGGVACLATILLAVVILMPAGMASLRSRFAGVIVNEQS